MLFKKSKKNIAILLVIAMLLTIMPMTVFAEGEGTGSSELVVSENPFNLTAELTTGSAITTPSIYWYVGDTTEPTKVTENKGITASVDDSEMYTYSATEEFAITEDTTITAELRDDLGTIFLTATWTITLDQSTGGGIVIQKPHWEVDKSKTAERIAEDSGK